MILAFLGIVLLFSNSLSMVGGALGMIYVLMAAASLGMGVTLFKKLKLASDFPTTIWLAAPATFPMAAILYIRGGAQAFIDASYAMTSTVMAGILYASYIVTVVSGCIWLWLLRRYPSSL